MTRKINSARKQPKKNYLSKSTVYALTAIYGEGWHRMNDQALMTAIKTIEESKVKK